MLLTDFYYREKTTYRGLLELDPAGVIYSPWYQEIIGLESVQSREDTLEWLMEIAHHSPSMETTLGMFPPDGSTTPDTMQVAVTHTTGRLFYLPEEQTRRGLCLPGSMYHPDLPIFVAVKSTGSNRTNKFVNFAGYQYIEGFSREWTEDAIVPWIAQEYGPQPCMRMNGDIVNWSFIPSRIPVISIPIKRLRIGGSSLDLTHYDSRYPLATGQNQLHANIFITPMPITYKDIGLLAYKESDLARPVYSELWKRLAPIMKLLPIYQFDGRRDILSGEISPLEVVDLTEMIIQSWTEQVFLDLQILCWYFKTTMRHWQNTTPAGMSDFEQWIYEPTGSRISFQSRFEKSIHSEANGVSNFLFEIRKMLRPDERIELQSRLSRFIDSSIMSAQNKQHWTKMYEAGLIHGVSL